MEMRPELSMDSLMVLGIETSEVLPLLSSFFLGFSSSWVRWLDLERCLWLRCEWPEVVAATEVAWLDMVHADARTITTATDRPTD
jgi:hypothetical protein